MAASSSSNVIPSRVDGEGSGRGNDSLPTRPGSSPSTRLGMTERSRCVNPRSLSSSSSRTRASSMKLLYHEVEDAVRDDELRSLRDARRCSVTRDDEHLVVLGVEADRCVGDVV